MKYQHPWDKLMQGIHKPYMKETGFRRAVSDLTMERHQVPG